MKSESYVSADGVVDAIKRAAKRVDQVRMVDVLSQVCGSRPMASIGDRMVDRALQRTRKAGRIAFNSKMGWAVRETVEEVK